MIDNVAHLLFLHGGRQSVMSATDVFQHIVAARRCKSTMWPLASVRSHLPMAALVFRTITATAECLATALVLARKWPLIEMDTNVKVETALRLEGLATLLEGTGELNVCRPIMYHHLFTS